MHILILVHSAVYAVQNVFKIFLFPVLGTPNARGIRTNWWHYWLLPYGLFRRQIYHGIVKRLKSGIINEDPKKNDLPSSLNWHVGNSKSAWNIYRS